MMSKILKDFQINKSGRLDLINTNDWIRTNNFDGTHQKFYLGTSKNPQIYFVKTFSEDSLGDLCEVSFSKILKHLNLPYVDTFLGETLISKKPTPDENLFNKLILHIKNNDSNKQYKKCIISENFKDENLNLISFGELLANAKNKAISQNDERANLLDKFASLKEIKNAIEILEEYNLPESTEIEIEKLLVLDYCLGETDRSSRDLYFEVDKNNNLTLAPVTDNERCNLFGFSHKILGDVTNSNYNILSFTDKYTPRFKFTNENFYSDSFIDNMLNYENLHLDEMLNFVNEIQNINLHKIFQEIKVDTGYSTHKYIIDFYEDFKNTKCEILCSELEANLSVENNIEANSISDIEKDNENLNL